MIKIKLVPFSIITPFIFRYCIIFFVAFPSLTGAYADTRYNDGDVCDGATRYAAKKTGVPEEVLYAIARVESGRTIANKTFAPWPWTINRAGAGEFLTSQAQAIARVRQAVANGERNIDIGCFQINLYWHGEKFDSIEAMMDPRSNALYAAHFLRSLYKESGDWWAAIGKYHSRDPAFSKIYLEKISKFINNIQRRIAEPIPEIVVAQETRSVIERTNRAQPLFASGSEPDENRRSSGLGSLLTADSHVVPLIVR